MRYLAWARFRIGRLLSVLLALLIYFLLLSTEALHFFPRGMTDFSSVLLFGFSAFVALLFLAVGALVWLYARDRLVALLLFCYSITMMVTFAAEMGAVLNIPLFLAITTSSSVLSLSLFSALLLVFPKNYLSSASQSRRLYIFLLGGYLALLTLSNAFISLSSALSYFLFLQLPGWIHIIAYIFVAPILTGILITIIVSYRQSSSLRARQQQRIFVGGVILTFAPLLILTILPFLLNLPGVAGQFSSITFAVLPLALGYSILRYQILIFDRYIQRVVAWITGVIGLVLLGYLVTAPSSLLLSSDTLAYIAFVSLSLLILSPCIWWLAQMATEWFFFQEMAYYRRLINQPNLLARETFDIDGATRLITTAAVNAFETQEVCLFVLDEEIGSYHLYPSLKNDDSKDALRRNFAQHLFRTMNPSADEGSDVQASPLQHADRLMLQSFNAGIVERLSSSKRPLLLSEASRPEEEMPAGLARYLATGPSGGFDPLLAPVRVQGKIIGVLVCGERGDAQPYAGPDFEMIQLLVDRYGSVLETARLYEVARQQQARINRELRDAYERQKELDRLKDQFITTASHELRTPLTAVVGYIELLGTYNESISTERRAEFIAKAHRGCDELTLVVSNIMEAGRVQDDIENLNLGRVPLAKSVVHILEILEGITQKQHRSITMTIPNDLYVMADDLRLRQVLLNLMSNAIKYSPEDTNIDLSCDFDEENVTVRIRDHGLGVLPRDQQRLFGRFMRLERDMNSPARGAGLGLHISKQLVEAMEGRIWVESTGVVGEGSTFAFTLKRALVTQEDAPLWSSVGGVGREPVK